MNLEPDYQRDIEFESEVNKKRSGIMQNRVRWE